MAVISCICNMRKVWERERARESTKRGKYACHAEHQVLVFLSTANYIAAEYEQNSITTYIYMHAHT